MPPPASAKMWYLVAYDIRDPKRLRLAAKQIKGYGTRLQYSLFRCRLSKKQLEKLRWELSKILENEDDLLIIGLCSSCVERIRAKNIDLKDWKERPKGFEII